MTNMWQSAIYPFLSSPATTSLVAIIAATGAFVIYFMRHRDHKKDARSIGLFLF